MKSIAKEFFDHGLNYDRLPSDIFSLPNQLEDIKIQPNDLAVASVFNQKIKKLYDNFLYLYGICFISSFNINKKYRGWFDEINGFIPENYNDFWLTATTGKTPALSASTKAVAFRDSRAPNIINTVFTSNSAVGILTIEKIIEDIEYINLPLQLILTSGLTPGTSEYINVINNIEKQRNYINSYRGAVKFTQTSIDPLSGSINFQNIGGIAQINNELLYMTDSIFDNVYSYNLKDAAGNDNIKKNILFQLNIVGGEGSIQEKIKFNTPTLTVNVDDNILIIDQANSCFKIFDKNLNWVSTSTQSVFFKQYPKQNAAIFYSAQRILVIATDTDLHLFSVSTAFDISYIKSISVYTETLAVNKIIDIKFANYDSDVLYILTNKSIIKKWMSKLEKNIAAFNIDGPGSLDLNLGSFYWLTLSPLDSTTDILLVRAGKENTNSFILIFEDDLNLVSLLKQQDFNVYSKNEICLNDQEYVSSWTYNKSFKKLLYNLNLLTSNLVFRFYTKEKEATGTTEFILKTYNNIINEKTIQDTNTYANIFINENFQSETVNRCFSLLFDYQNYILNTLSNNDPINVDLTPHRVV